MNEELLFFFVRGLCNSCSLCSSDLREGENEEREDIASDVRSSGALDIDESFLAATPAAYYKTQRHLSKELSRARPELTLGIFSGW